MMVPTPSGNPVLARMRAGARLKKLRLDAGVTQADAGRVVRASHSKISRLEGGLSRVEVVEVKKLLKLYGVSAGPVHDELLGLAQESALPGWWEEFSGELPAGAEVHLAREQAANRITVYDPHAIPAILQTDEYARAICDRGRYDQRWRSNLTAQALAWRREGVYKSSPTIWALIHEAALRRQPRGEPDILLRQLQELIKAAESLRVTIQIIPEEAPAVLYAAGPFSVLRFDSPDLPDAVMLELTAALASIGDEDEISQHKVLIERIMIQGHRPELTIPLLHRLTDTFGDAADTAAPATSAAASAAIPVLPPA